jgi:glycosyltransferase involved in cell wall biosynthesis
MADPQAIDVLHLIGTLSPGGAERNLYYLAPHLKASRLRYAICCLVARGDFAGEIERLGIPVFELGYRRRYAPWTILKLARLLRRHRVRVLHTHLFESGLIGRPAAWLARVPVIVTHEHGKTLWKRWYHRLFERLALPWTDLRIAVSEDIRNLRMKYEHTPPDKSSIVFNAVDPARFDVPEAVRSRKRAELGLHNFFVIGTVGRLVEAKSYDLMLEVAGEVCRRRQDARFVLVGEGRLAAELHRMKDTLGLAESLRFLGMRKDIPELMAAMDLYVITSKREGLPISLIEAMMAGKAIVSTGVGGIPDTLTDGRDGVLVEPGSKDALVEAILDLAANSGKRARLGKNARQTAIERYSPERIVGQLEHIYRGLLSQKGVPIGDTSC